VTVLSAVPTTGRPSDDQKSSLKVVRFVRARDVPYRSFYDIGAKLAKVRFVSKTYHAEATHFRFSGMTEQTD